MSTGDKTGYSKISGFLSCRQVLNIMVILGFMLNYALRVNLTIAIVAMAKDPAANNNSSIVNETQMGENGTFTVTTEITSTGGKESTDEDDGKFDWDEMQQNFIMGSFFFGYILTELPGGRLAELIGGRRVFGHSMLWASVLTLLTPCAATISYVALVIVRILLGFMLGASWPAIQPLAAVWIPPMERSKFISNMMASSLGAAITMPICGYLISFMGWQSVFYFTGIIGVAWSLCWFIFIYESPATHPRISPEEKREIEEAIGSSTSKKRPSYVPWTSILSSSAVWAIIITHGCSVFGYFTVVHQLPTYMKTILHFKIKENGLLSSLPYLGKYIMAVSASCLADYLRRTEKLTTTATRKIFTVFAVGLPGFLMIAQVFLGYYASWSIAIFTIALTLNGAVTAGYLANGLDIAPNFSGTIFGMANTLSSFGGFLSNYIVGVLTNHNQSYGQWQIVFWILASTYLIGSLAYATMGSGVLQPWNNPPEKNRISDVEAEGVPLKNKIVAE